MKRLFGFFVKLFFWSVVFSVGLVVFFKFVPVAITPLMLIRYFENPSEKKIWKHN